MIETDYQKMESVLKGGPDLPMFFNADIVQRFRVTSPTNPFPFHPPVYYEVTVPLCIETDDLGIGVAIAWLFNTSGRLVYTSYGGRTPTLSAKELETLRESLSK